MDTPPSTIVSKPDLASADRQPSPRKDAPERSSSDETLAPIPGSLLVRGFNPGSGEAEDSFVTFRRQRGGQAELSASGAHPAEGVDGVVGCSVGPDVAATSGVVGSLSQGLGVLERGPLLRGPTPFGLGESADPGTNARTSSFSRDVEGVHRHPCPSPGEVYFNLDDFHPSRGLNPSLLDSRRPHHLDHWSAATGSVGARHCLV